jgi:anti-sigma-K factor RskA
VPGRPRGSIRFWRGAAAVAAVFALALMVAAAVARPPPDFAGAPIVAVLRDPARQPAWTVRLAPVGHLIAADALQPEPPPPDRVYQLWLAIEDGRRPRWLGLLPPAGRKRIAVTPENMRLLLAGAGELVVTSEPEGGASKPEPSGPALFRGRLMVPASRLHQSSAKKRKAARTVLAASAMNRTSLRKPAQERPWWKGSASPPTADKGRS